MNRVLEICNAFNSSAYSYEKNAKVQHEIGTRLIERLQYLKMSPHYILDLGCGPGIFSRQLKSLYPKAIVVGLDVAQNMLKLAKDKQSWHRKWQLVNADMVRLPFKINQFDLIFSNQVLHWPETLTPTLNELHRVLSPQGCLLFSTIGPDTFKEIRQAFGQTHPFSHVNEFLDMHDIGDCLMQSLFDDPVVDMEMLTAHYSNVTQLLHALKGQGVRNINPKRNSGLTGRQTWHNFEQAMLQFKTIEGKFPLTYEVVYGHAWKGMQRRTNNGVESSISLAQLRINNGIRK